MPSSHTMNSLVLNGYTAYFLLKRDYVPPEAAPYLYAAVCAWTCGLASRASTWACTRQSTSPAVWRPESSRWAPTYQLMVREFCQQTGASQPCLIACMLAVTVIL